MFVAREEKVVKALIPRQYGLEELLVTSLYRILNVGHFGIAEADVP